MNFVFEFSFCLREKETEEKRKDRRGGVEKREREKRGEMIMDSVFEFSILNSVLNSVFEFSF